MADDWDQVTKIGSKVRSGAAVRETVVRGKGALNAAQRSGAIIGTEKKYTTGNAASKPGVEGQRLTKVDRSDDIVKPSTVGIDVGKAIAKARTALQPPKSQSELAKHLSVNPSVITDYERGTAIPDGKLLQRMEGILKVKLTGKNPELIGKPLGGPKDAKKGTDEKKGKDGKK